MDNIDWSATGSMIGGIGSIIAVGVAVALSELQHRRTIRLIERQDRKAAEERSHETSMLALWACSVVFDLRVKADSITKPFGSITIKAEGKYPAEDAASLDHLLNGFPLNFDSLSPKILDALPRFPREAGVYIIAVIRQARAFDLRNRQLAGLARTGSLNTTSLQTSIGHQVRMLVRIRDNCDKAHAALAETYGFETVETKLAELQAQRAGEDTGT